MSAVGSVNKAQAGVLAALLFFGSGYAYWKYLYTPATASRATAQQRATNAERAVTEKQSQLAAIESKKTGKATKEALSKTVIAKEAIPQEEDAAEAMVQIERLARLANVTVTNQAVSNLSLGVATAAASSEAKSVGLEISGHGTYPALILFLGKIQQMVEARAGKLYVKGRLMSIQSLKITTDDDSTSSSTGGAVGSNAIPEGHIPFTVTLKLYSATASTAPPATSAQGGQSCAAPTSSANSGTPPASTPPAGTQTGAAQSCTTPPPGTQPTTPGGSTTQPTTTTTPQGTTPAAPTSASTPPEQS